MLEKCAFQPISRRISETVRDRTRLLLVTNRMIENTEAPRGNRYAPARGMRLMMMTIMPFQMT